MTPETAVGPGSDCHRSEAQKLTDPHRSHHAITGTKLNQAFENADLKRLCAHLHRVGERSVYEFVREVAGGADPIARLEAYERLDPAILAYLGGDRIPLIEGARQ